MVYNSSWSRCIEEAQIGLKVEGHFCGAFFCADDSLSCTTSIAELIAVSYIYDFFKNENDVEFAFAKTILNIFNNEIMRNDIMDSLATNERAFCDISVYFNLHQTKQD